MAESFIRAVDCLSLPVPDLDEALAFYRDCLGHEVLWRTPSSVGLRLPESEAELVLHTDERRPLAAELRVDAVPEAMARFHAAGGSLVAGPFEIQIGRCAVVAGVRAAGAEIATPIADRPYGLRDFDVRDPSGNQLDFGQPVEGAGDA